MILCRIWWWWAMTQRDKAVWGERLEDRGTRAGHGAAGFMSPRSVLRGDSLGAASPRAGVRREVVWPCSLFKSQDRLPCACTRTRRGLSAACTSLYALPLLRSSGTLLQPDSW